jgi:hypothetical protein
MAPRWTSQDGGSGTLSAAPTAGTTTAAARTITNGVVVGPLATAGVLAGSLSCLCVLLAQTTNITLTPKFQVSDDGSTWYDFAASAYGPDNQIQCTGTSGTDTATSKTLPVTDSVLGWKYVRAAVVNGVATGAVGDTYAFTWKFRKAP